MAEKLQFESYNNEENYAPPAEISAKAERLIAKRNKRLGNIALKNIKY